ncbi:probable serine/threonine-protein kinase dyrk2 [Apis florea]|uniref:probable serine/threonine-protein kinase dyrk2 n=1 Tax=Apis florea TaxID=7463 RepID=UPI0012FEA9EA|nr:probable serine/threonine-protein kinase dyrk2 [Apis florea]
MSMQQFCLRWNNHQPNFISVFSNLLNNETLVDVTLAAEGRHLQAHKVVLSACSTYFQSLFTVNPCQHPIVILKDVKFSDLKIIVDFMYYGEVNISQDQLSSIIKTAESLKIKGLAEMHNASLTKWPSGSSEPGGGDRGESCSPSPSPLSPSFRRKRLRKSSTGSTSGSGDKPEEINEITLVATNIVKPEPLIVSQENNENIRRPVNTNTESQGSIDEDQISIMSNMENSSTATPAQSDGSIQDVSQQSGGNVAQSSVPSQPPAHQGLQWTIMEHTYPRFALSSCQTNLSIQASSAFTTPEITASSTISDQYSGTSTTGSSCALTNYPNSSHGGTLQHTSSSGPSPSTQCPSNCQSPCASPQTAIKRKRSTNPQADENFIRALDAVRYGGIGFCKAARMFGVNNRTLWLEYKKRGYPNNRPSLKSRVKQEVNSSPPPAQAAQPVNSQSPTPMGPPTTPHSTHNTHSTHTMLTTHSPHTMLSGYIDSRHTDYALPIIYAKQVGPKRYRLLRQPRVKKESNHLSPDSEASSPHIVSSPIYVTTPTLSLPQTSKSLDETRISPLPPQSILVNQPSLLTVTTTTNLLTVPQPSYLMKQHSHPLLPTQQQSGSGNYWIHRQHSNPEFPRRTTSPSIVVEPAPVIKTEEDILEDPIATTTTTTSTTDSTTTAGSTSGLRVKTTELRRSSSSPQTTSRETRDNTGDLRVGHCPVLRPGPALRCNHCWNTIDAQGRTLRRKTKYHCPQCQDNLCIVPCFQEYHERRELKLKPLPKTSSV